MKKFQDSLELSKDAKGKMKPMFYDAMKQMTIKK